jgi:hypothetical protein
MHPERKVRRKVRKKMAKWKYRTPRPRQPDNKKRLPPLGFCLICNVFYPLTRNWKREGICSKHAEMAHANDNRT